MKKSIMMAALMIAPALGVHAQQAPSASPPAKTETVAPEPETDAKKAPAARSDRAAQAGQSAATMSTGWSVKDRLGTAVYNSAGDRVGDVNDIIVGGFLGMGEKQVAVSPSELKSVVQKDGKPHFVVEATKESMEAAPPHTRPRS